MVALRGSSSLRHPITHKLRARISASRCAWRACRHSIFGVQYCLVSNVARARILFDNFPALQSSIIHITHHSPYVSPVWPPLRSSPSRQGAATSINAKSPPSPLQDTSTCTRKMTYCTSAGDLARHPALSRNSISSCSHRTVPFDHLSAKNATTTCGHLRTAESSS
jgi:hypothetical protein